MIGAAQRHVMHAAVIAFIHTLCLQRPAGMGYPVCMRSTGTGRRMVRSTCQSGNDPGRRTESIVELVDYMIP